MIDKLLFQKVTRRQHISFKSVLKTFRADFWLVTALALLEKVNIQAFLLNVSEMFQTKFNFDMQEATYIIMIPSLVFLGVGLFIGYITD